ncbi:dTDP-4-dehydrorhamnose reductase [Bradyrhizobium elkanii]|uniref:dTDP-4-dehydrorhamnose reductase n=1 Tax=Bradyrhizobium elkanii TaxID=29448 RepID=UPI003D19CE8D
MRLYIIGGEGQIARSLREAAAALEGDVVFGYGARPMVDLLQPLSIEKAIAAFRPDVVVNPAAYTAVDKAETEPDLAFAVNRDGARVAARVAAEQGVPIIHISTDYVFDGTKEGAYVEGDPVNPRGVYGRSKLEGELAVARANPKHIMLRTSWVYSPFGNNFVRTILRLAEQRDRLRVVDDQVGCPTYAPEIARVIIAIARQVTGARWNSTFTGVTHVAGPDAMSWHSFAQEIVRGAAERSGRSVPVDPIATSDYPTAALRPANSALSTSRLRAAFGIDLPATRVSLSACLDHLLQRNGGSPS